MFGLDKMFDFNRDGKLDSWERAAQFLLEFSFRFHPEEACIADKQFI